MTYYNEHKAKTVDALNVMFGVILGVLALLSLIAIAAAVLSWLFTWNLVFFGMPVMCFAVLGPFLLVFLAFMWGMAIVIES